jgi:hypothetical protein
MRRGEDICREMFTGKLVRDDAKWARTINRVGKFCLKLAGIVTKE